MPDRPLRFVPYIYSTKDIRQLLGVPDSHYPRACPLSPDTMRTLISVLYGTGLRLGEASRLTHQNADFRNAALMVRKRSSASRGWFRSKGSCQHLELYRNATSSGRGVPTPSHAPRYKIGMTIRNVMPTINSNAEKGSWDIAI